MTETQTTDSSSVPKEHSSHSSGKLAPLTLAALGIVFGDIGTSPLYTFQTILNMSSATVGHASIMGSLSLVLWTLVVITTIKYVSFAMRVDNDGEGGILALMALLGLRKHRPAIVVAGLFGAALIYGDGAVTPAISVLSALEGLQMVEPAIEPYIMPIAIVILIGLFVVQANGTARIGQAFGPIMVLWFVVIAVMGIAGIVRHPRVLEAINPAYGVHYLFSHGFHGFLILGGVFLCVTGAEALYADMGHFGPRPIRVSWFAIVFPALFLNYAGQAALVLDGEPKDGNIFFHLCPAPLLIPLVILATLATIIASQAIITGAFSMSRQAMQLGWLPRMTITQTSSTGYGQIYIPSVNWILMVVTVGLALAFKKSENLAAAYGIAVSLTMLMTSVLLFIAMRDIWGWSLPAAGAVAVLFVAVDASFFVANAVKIADGGYVPLILAIAVFGLMRSWHFGARRVAYRMRADSVPIETFLKRLETDHIARVPGAAIFLTRMEQGTPPLMLWHVDHSRSLHETLIALRVSILQVPWVGESERLHITEIAPNFWSLEAHYGFMERPRLPELLQSAHAHGCAVDPTQAVFYVGHNRVLPSSHSKLRRWQQSLFMLMERNAAHASDVFGLPGEQVVEIGRQLKI